MAFTPSSFQDLPSTATPITADEMNKLGTQHAQVLTDVLANDASPASPIRVQQDARLYAAFDRLRVLNVINFGAVGDWNGTSGTDNITAFRAVSAELLTASTPCIVYVPAGDYMISEMWMIDGEDVEVICDPSATIRTVSTTQLGGAVTFMGNGLQGADPGDPDQNATPNPKRHRAVWRGGRIVATGSGTLDVGLGVVRYENCHISDVTVDADRHGITAQYGIHNLVFERVEVTRAGLDGVHILSAGESVTLRDIHVVSVSDRGIALTSNSATDPLFRNTDVLLDNIRVDAAGTWGVQVAFSDRVTLKKVNSVGVSGGVRLENATEVTIDADCTFSGGVSFGTGATLRNALAVDLTFANGWSNFGGNYGTARARLDGDGFVNLEGAIKGGTLTSGTQIAAIPLGYRPMQPSQPRFSTLCVGSTGSFADIYVTPGGAVVLAQTLTAGTLLSLDGCRFPAA